MIRLKLWFENLQLKLLALGISSLENKFNKMNLKLIKTIEKEEAKYKEVLKLKTMQIIKIENEINNNESKWNERKNDLNNKRKQVVNIKNILGGE